MHCVSNPLQPPHFPNEHKPNTTRSAFLLSCSLIPFYSLQAARLFSPPFFAIVLNWYNQCLIGSFALVDCWRYHNIIPYYTIRTAPFISPLWIWISIPRAETSLDSLSKSKRFYTGCSCQAALPYTASCWFYPFFPTWGVKPTEFIWRVYIGSIPLEEARLHWIKGEWVEVETRWSGLLPLQPSNTHPTDTALNHLRWCALIEQWSQLSGRESQSHDGLQTKILLARIPVEHLDHPQPSSLSNMSGHLCMVSNCSITDGIGDAMDNALHGNNRQPRRLLHNLHPDPGSATLASPRRHHDRQLHPLCAVVDGPNRYGDPALQHLGQYQC